MLKNDFNVTGFYYNFEGNKYRKYLDIKKNGSTKDKADIMVVMMNPGSSKHKDGSAEDYDCEVDTIPDMTQYKIMAVMKNCNLNYARVLNLSDLRQKESSKFYGEVAELKPNHSIFSAERREDLQELFIQDIPIIAAWGVSKKLEKLRSAALGYLGEKQLIGYAKMDAEHCYYHPLARLKNRAWVDEITKQLKK